MDNNLYFKNVVNIGDLFLEYIFFDFEREPIVFTCVDNFNNLYLCTCADIRYGQKWIISKCSITTLKNLILGGIDIATAMRVPNKLTIIYANVQGVEQSWIINTSDIDELDLPEEGVFFEEADGDFRSYLQIKDPNFTKPNFDVMRGYQCSSNRNSLNYSNTANCINITGITNLKEHGEAISMESKQNYSYKNEFDSLLMIPVTALTYASKNNRLSQDETAIETAKNSSYLRAS